MTSNNWRPSSPVQTAMRRARMLDTAHRFFTERNVLEVDTPLLSPTAVSDPHIESIRAELVVRPNTPYFLQTSPEYFMKRLLCAGYPDIFQICKAFRDGEAGNRHSPEFTLIEWYRRDFGLRQMMQETVDLVSALVDPRSVEFAPKFVEYRAAFEELAGVDPMRATFDALAEAAGADERLVESLGDDRDAWLDLVLSIRVVPRFDSGRLTVLYHYPASQAALARLCADDASVADRFEVFFGDLELANGFVELRDADAQLRRFEADQVLRRKRGHPRRPLDQRLIAALRSGLPACAGVAVGFDRLLMINEMSEDIRRVQTFPFDEDDDT
ncbi:MAG: EF-P lysine aminoacylase EpmA [Woeseiaceae bacterium]